MFNLDEIKKIRTAVNWYIRDGMAPEEDYKEVFKKLDYEEELLNPPQINFHSDLRHGKSTLTLKIVQHRMALIKKVSGEPLSEQEQKDFDEFEEMFQNWKKKKPCEHNYIFKRNIEGLEIRKCSKCGDEALFGKTGKL